MKANNILILIAEAVFMLVSGMAIDVLFTIVSSSQLCIQCSCWLVANI
ncbi:MAG: hypothetical protein HOC24_07600 [Deltaproteobacteria bacterium]|nr:hypothetical protein [Deltaproteobacteria bacterium]